jgi:hypothetical protein
VNIAATLRRNVEVGLRGRIAFMVGSISLSRAIVRLFDASTK